MIPSSMPGPMVPRPKKHLADLLRVPNAEEDRSGFLRLDKNENLTGFPVEVLDDLRSFLTEDLLATYPDAAPLYRSLAKHAGVEPDQLFLASGSDGAIKSVFEVYVEAADEVLLLSPTYAMFGVYARMFQARPVEVAYERGPALSVDKVIAQIRPATKLVCIANPNSPTGTVFARSDMERLINVARASDALVLADEAYYEYSGETVADLLPRYENLIVTRTFSKALGLASARLGYIVSNRRIVSDLFKVRPMYEINGLAARFGLYLLDHPELVSRHLKEIACAKVILERAASRAGFSMPASFANFALINVGSREKAIRIREFMRRENILIKGGFDEPSMAPCIRVSLGRPVQMELFAEKLEMAAR